MTKCKDNAAAVELVYSTTNNCVCVVYDVW